MRSSPPKLSSSSKSPSPAKMVHRTLRSTQTLAASSFLSPAGKTWDATRYSGVVRGQDVGRYQVSWSAEHKLARSGTYEVKFFDEESYSALRKAQRNKEDYTAMKPLFAVSVDHRGAWSGPWVATEVVAAAIGLLVYYLAFSAKSNIQA
ncbi:translocon-associated protein subunit delta isoform X2 [Mobula hypostoma]|uniref:translocon-associated protein subunit delta isoform X2 n=1 Tax=Mobula hypostoma TaxID=723540 RepID=UPI002FC29DB4